MEAAQIKAFVDKISVETPTILKPEGEEASSAITVNIQSMHEKPKPTTVLEKLLQEWSNPKSRVRIVSICVCILVFIILIIVLNVERRISHPAVEKPLIANYATVPSGMS